MKKQLLKLLQQYEHVDGVVANLDQLTKAQKTKIEADLEMLYLSRKLAEIKTDVPIEYDLKQSKFQFNKEKALDKFAEVGMRGLDRFIDIEKAWA